MNLRNLPDGWRRARLGYLAETHVPQRDKPETLTGPIPWVRIEDFNGQYIEASKTKQGVTEEQVRAMNLRVYESGTVLCSCSCTMGATAIVQAPLVSNQTFIGLTPGRDLESRFLFYLLLAMKNELQAQATGAIQQYLSRDDFRSLRVSLPPTGEQRRIANFLDAETARIDTVLSTEGRLLKRLAERRTAGVIAAVAQTEKPDRKKSSLPWLDTIPSSWDEVRLGLLAQMGSGHTPSRSHPEWWTDCTIPWITTGEVQQVRSDRVEEVHETREKISEIGLANSAAELHPKGTVFLCRTASAGFSGIMGLDMATSQDFVTWTCGSRLSPQYLLWCLRAMRPDLLGRLAMGSTHKTIYVPDLQMLRIPLPSLKEQSEIVEIIRRRNAWIDALTDKVGRQSSLLKERRQALITAAVTGQFDVSSASGRGVDPA
ncbi:restriction endonuclease subunit S [Streptomyces qinglanensis]|uniref:restriction endonuclease subunit S n=1 Tax=Streptomyces qinglanensis TaxID=943816 RepID=UPI0037923886